MWLQRYKQSERFKAKLNDKVDGRDGGTDSVTKTIYSLIYFVCQGPVVLCSVSYELVKRSTC